MVLGFEIVIMFPDKLYIETFSTAASIHTYTFYFLEKLEVEENMNSMKRYIRKKRNAQLNSR